MYQLSIGSSRRRAAWFAIALAALAVWFAVMPAPRVEAASAQDWSITNTSAPGAEVRTDRTYRLFNRTHGRALVYGGQDHGINLDWASPNTTPNVRFVRRAGTGPVQYAELVAIHVAGGGYLRYWDREYGINLVWSDTPVYEWRLYGGVGSIKTSEPIFLYNAVEHDHVVYASRQYGIHLRWLNSVGPRLCTSVDFSACD